MNEVRASFKEPNGVERVINNLFGMLVGLGLGLSHNYVLEVQGRKSSRIYSTPVNLLMVNGRRYLVAPRGETQWVRNARSTGEIWLKKGRRRHHFRLRTIPDEEKPQLLKSYLDRFRTTVQRYFPIPAGSAPEAFSGIVAQYPVFELEPVD
jgi:deazaflavin-dependent oxidoreductase (nitroreductase family)